jgi:hypothetical protein
MRGGKSGAHAGEVRVGLSHSVRDRVEVSGSFGQPPPRKVGINLRCPMDVKLLRVAMPRQCFDTTRPRSTGIALLVDFRVEERAVRSS